MHYAVALAATILVEALVLAVLARAAERRRVVSASLFVNLLTHPLAWIAVSRLTVPFAGVEAAVIVAEALLYAWVMPTDLARAALGSLVANGASLSLSWWL